MSDQRNFFQRALFSSFLSKKTDGGKIAYLAVCAAFIVVANTLLEFRMFETQISVTFFVSTVAGVILGGLSGFAACFLGDLLGFFINSWGMTYMFWVGLSTATVALIAGWTFTFFRPKFTLDMNGWSVDGDWLEWDYEVSEGGRHVASVSKQIWNWTDTYVIDVYDPQDALAALMLVLAIDAEKCSRN